MVQIPEKYKFIKVYSTEPDRAPDIISASEVTSLEPAPVSQMPPGLINALNADELRSLIAYLRSGGDPEHEAFR
jgi:hypothetical protein